MTTTAEERLTNPRSPQVSLTHGLRLSPVEVAALTAANSTTDPEDAWYESLMAFRLFAIRKAREELLNATVVNDTVIRKALDTVWVVYSPVFKNATAPMIAEAYIRAFRNVEQGNVPIQVIYALAAEHAERVGKYFNDTSADAIIQGFNTYVNRQIPQKAALERVLDAYGLSPRQMAGYTSAQQLQPTKMETSVPQRVKAKIKAYIGKSIAARLGIFKRQEAHNLEMQAQQTAWLWLVENGKLPTHAEKMWVTAKDEKVCSQCGPMNAKKVRVRDQFVMPNGVKVYVPGAHVNCRCTVKLQYLASAIKKDWDPREHPRGGNPKNRGQFSRKPRQPSPRTREREASPFLEEIMRGVEELQREKPAEKPTLKAPAPKPKLSAPVAKPALRAPEAKEAEPKLAAKPSLAAPVEQEKPVAKPRLEAVKPTLGVAKPTLSASKPKLEYDVAGLERLVDERQTAYQAHDVTPKRRRKRPTRKIKDSAGNEVPAYLILTGDELGIYGDSVALSESDKAKLHSSQRDRARWIGEHTADLRDQGVADAIGAIRSEYNFSPQFRTNEYGEDELFFTVDSDEVGPDGHELAVTAAVSEEDLRSALEEALWWPQEYGARSSHDKRSYTLSWTDDDGDLVSETQVTAAQLVLDYFGVSPDSYRPVVAKLEEGYDTAAPLDDETWSAPGNYTVVNNKFVVTVDPRTGEKVPYMQVTLRPNVREVEEIVHEPDETE